MNQTWPHYPHFCYRGLDANKILDQQKNTKYVVNVWYIAQPSAEAKEVKATFWVFLINQDSTFVLPYFRHYKEDEYSMKYVSN